MKIELSDEIKEFIERHQNSSSAEVALVLSKKPRLPKTYILNQINGWQKAKRKLPFLLDFPDFNYPGIKALAQSSSSATAEYKASIIRGKTLVDICGGMGMDSYFFSKNFNRILYLEPDEDLFNISKGNFKLLGSDNIECFCIEARNFLSEFTEEVDCIYIDPDRRNKDSKAFRIEDCEPNLIALLPVVWRKTKRCFIKLSPMLDISMALSQIKYCKEVHVVSVENECKELLFLLEKKFNEEAAIICHNISIKNSFKFKFKFSEEQNRSIQYSEPLQYLYDPTVSILKAGAFNSIGARFNLQKLAANTHLYTSTDLVDQFPGRIFKVKNIHPPSKGLVREANVSSKNFPLSVKEIRKKYRINDGGSVYLFACGLANKKKVFILTEKVHS